MNADECGFAVDGVSTRQKKSRESVLSDALLEMARIIEDGRGPEAWNADQETVVQLSEGRSISIVAVKGRSFAATCVDGGMHVRIVCPIVDELEGIDDDGLRAAAHARWSARVLKSPRSKDRHPAWTEAATNIASLAAMFRTGGSGACTLRPGRSMDPIKVECTGTKDWRIDHSRSVTDYVARTCPTYLQVQHVRRKNESLIVIGHGPETMCFASTPDAMEALRLMESTGLDPADLFRVVDDLG